jgi:murein hydrolase activator
LILPHLLRAQNLTAPLLAVLFFFACSTSAAPTSSASAPAPATAQTTEHKQKLNGLRGRIDSLSRDLAKAEESRSDVADQLRETEVAISLASRRVHEMGLERQKLQADLARIDTQIQTLDKSTANEQRQLERLLNRQFIQGESDALTLLLGGKDPNQAAQDRYFLSRLAHAKAELARELREVSEKKRGLRDETAQRETELRAVEARHKTEHAQLLKEQQRRSALLASLAGKISQQRKDIGTLKRDEQRITKLLDGLARLGARSKAKPAKSTQSPKVSAGKTAIGEPKDSKADPKISSHDPKNATGAFASLRARLPLPVQGRITGTFGSKRGDEAGGVWRGLFIRAAEGTSVRSVASGEVVYADWLRGFGNLLIVDHGDDFLAIYAFNEALLKHVGDSVRAGDTVAHVGNSGGSADSGLYFELRHQGKAFDPKTWLAP